MTAATDAMWQNFLGNLPLMAILRGIRPPEALDVAEALYAAGFLCLEVPLNSPEPLESISRIRTRFEGKLLVGAGTVLTVAQVNAVVGAGAQLVVSPNTNPEVITAVKSAGMISNPGFATPTEAFAALQAGADALKLFPAELFTPAALRALKAVLPAAVPVIPVGGISSTNMAAYLACGAAGFGIGSSVYQPGVSALEVSHRATELVAAWRKHPLRAESQTS